MSEHVPVALMELWHPRGVQVSLPIDPVNPPAIAEWRAIYDSVGLALDAGWLVQCPGMEEGEEKDDVGWVLKMEQEKDGEVTPCLLLYSSKENLKFSIVKVYLNKPEDITAFEYASKMKLAALPLYEGTNKPERGSNSKTDRLMVVPPKPFGFVFKKNPKHDPNEEDIKKMKPARLFVRWADQAPASQPAAEPAAAQPTATVAEYAGKQDVARCWQRAAEANLTRDAFLGWLAENYNLADPDHLTSTEMVQVMGRLQKRKDALQAKART